MTLFSGVGFISPFYYWIHNQGSVRKNYTHTHKQVPKVLQGIRLQKQRSFHHMGFPPVRLAYLSPAENAHSVVKCLNLTLAPSPPTETEPKPLICLSPFILSEPEGVPVSAFPTTRLWRIANKHEL